MSMAAKTKKRRLKPSNGAHRPSALYRLPPKESEEIILAIRRGKIDALVVAGDKGDEVLTLQGTDYPYRVLIETINDGVATLDEDGNILYANSRIAAMLKIPGERFIGTSLLSHFPVAERGKLKSLIAEGLANSSRGEVALNTTGSRPRLVRLSINPIKRSDPPTACVVATELTELTEANEALRSNEEALRQLSARLLRIQDEERRHIARDLHDITGQKIAFQSMALSEVLNRASLDQASKTSLQECATLTKQVGEEIRTLSYLLHPPLLDELGLSSAVKWYAEGLERRAGIRIKVDIAPDFMRLPPDVEVTLFRVIQESLTNVQRYSGSSTAFVQVKVVSKDIVVKIEDAGGGMRHPSINSRTGEVAPLGVGIQGMKERMRQLAGRLEIVSLPGKGTQVKATLPLGSLRDTPPLSSEDSPILSATAHKHSSSAEGISLRKRILIVDDHEMLRRGIRTTLQKELDLEVCGEAADGQEAINQVLALRPDLVILDINLPVLNGLVAIRQILRHRPQTKILVFTVHDSEQTAKEVRATGAHGYLPKGKEGDDLLQVVKTLLAGNAEHFPATHSG
ncbi:MAG: hypothetical protein NVS9B4_11720 [Candidatus Acidiferrum sp.]